MFRESGTTIKIKFALFGGGPGQGGAGRKLVQNAIFHGKRHDNKILKVNILLSRNLLSWRRLLRSPTHLMPLSVVMPVHRLGPERVLLVLHSIRIRSCFVRGFDMRWCIPAPSLDASPNWLSSGSSCVTGCPNGITDREKLFSN